MPETSVYFSARRRLFDLMLPLLAAPLWIPVVALSALALWLTEGRPVLYISKRRVGLRRTQGIVKFRTMVLNADKVVNRETVKITDTCFLNIPPDSPLYTPIGRFLERCHFTELPQFIHVLSGAMRIIGCRPLPENVIASLRQHYPYAEDRFLSKAGLTGPVQLVGRESISDADRLYLEIEYALVCMFSYSMALDLAILIMTVWVASGLRSSPFTPSEVRRLMARFSQRSIVACQWQGTDDRLHFRYLGRDRIVPFIINDTRICAHLQDLSYLGARLRLRDSSLPLTQGMDLTLVADEGALLPATTRWIRKEKGETTFGVTFHETGPRSEKLIALMFVDRDPVTGAALNSKTTETV